MNTIFGRADEKLVKSNIVYGKKSDNYIYEDAKNTIKLDKDTVLRMCMTDLIIVSYEGAFYKPVCFEDNTEKKCTSITFWDTKADSQPAAVTIHSKEYTA